MNPGQRMRLEELEAALASARDRESLLQLEVPLAEQNEKEARVRYWVAIARAEETTREKKDGLREKEREIRALEAEKDCILRNAYYKY
ncbi:hypothetical protein PHISP_00426 [Aspergillus sp. HF37]|nr:hypothetical protein PHISP_00426 [Aspergillus sp. HF37]